MTEFLTSTVSFDLFVDNYFTSFRLFACLPTLELANIRARGVLNKNRLHKYTIIMEKQLQKRNVISLNRAAHIKEKHCVTCLTG